MRAVLFCLVLSVRALPEAHLRGRATDRLRPRLKTLTRVPQVVCSQATRPR